VQNTGIPTALSVARWTELSLPNMTTFFASILISPYTAASVTNEQSLNLYFCAECISSHLSHFIRLFAFIFSVFRQCPGCRLVCISTGIHVM
jgi:hypothetical protein